MAKELHPKVKARQNIEKRIVRRAVKDILAAGNRISVSYERGYDLDEMLLGSTSVKDIMDAAFAVDECHLFVHSPKLKYLIDERGVLLSKGWVFLVFGNSGYDVISDYTVGLEPLLKGANDLGDEIEGKLP